MLTGVVPLIITALQLATAVEPDFAAVIAALDGAKTEAALLADADATETADEAKLKTEIKP